MRRFFRGANGGLAGLLFVFLVLTAYTRVAPPTPSLGSFLAVLKLLVQMMLAAIALLGLVRFLGRLPSRYLWLLFCTLVFLFYQFGRFEPWGQFWMAFFVVVPVTVLGGSLAVARESDGIVARLGVGAGLAGLAYGLYFFFRAGFAVEPPVDAAKLAELARIELPDPSAPGSYEVRTLSYGSGKDRHRPEFGADVDLVTESVDGSAFIDGWEKRSGWARTQYWGFDAEHLPLQGRVWYPEGEGPFPLVLVVHGNHAMEDFSDPGYAYLGELLASRGIILLSVDENFINSSFSARLDEIRGRGLKTENDARGYLLLKHLEQWREWNQAADSPFFEQVDMDRLGLIGHSRGGEAVAVAAAFNRLDLYPDDARIELDFDFAIRGIVAVAPVDGQYKPAGRGTRITDVDYFVIHGSHDGDVQSFAGSRQFERVLLTGESFRFKSSVYVYGANHGQFNSTWGRTDSSFPSKNFLNLKHIMPESDQARIARVYISAFFEASLNEELGYLPLFRDARAGGAWLPDTIYLTHYEDSTDVVVADFEEDLDLRSTSIPGGELSGKNLTTWRESLVELKRNDKGTSAVYLGWGEEEEDDEKATDRGTAVYRLTLPGGLDLSDGHALVFTLADASEGKPAEDPIDFTLEVEDGFRVTARLPLSHYAPVQPKIDVQVRKSALFNRSKTSEPVYQSFSFPLSDFLEAESKLDVAGITEVRFVFDRTEKGTLILDNIGFRELMEH